MHTVRVLVEASPKKVFASALDWPGLARSGKDESAALAALLRAMARYAPVAELAGEPFDAAAPLEVVEHVPGDASTAFGVPAVVAQADRQATDQAEADRLARLVDAAWRTFEAVSAAAPESLRKGPRGGGRDTSKVVLHVHEAASAYAAVMGRKHRPSTPEAVAAMRDDMVGILRQPSDGSSIAGRNWPPRYAARRIAWHALDHAWEIEDRTEPEPG